MDEDFDFGCAVMPWMVEKYQNSAVESESKTQCMMPSCSFLSLPQELRDLIFEFAIEGHNESSRARLGNLTPNDCRMKHVGFKRDSRWAWEAHHAAVAPTAAYLSLMRCNRQLRDEMRHLIERKQSQDRLPLDITLNLAYPNLKPVWMNIPLPPRRILDLDVLVKIDHMYHPAYMTAGSQNAILIAVFDVLKRYIHRGPHLARPSTLVQTLHLETVRITIAPPMPFEDMTFVYGFPSQQLETLFVAFKQLLAKLARSGIPFGFVEAFEVRMEGQEWERLPVTSNIWDEEDFVFFQHGGYIWDGGDMPDVEPDLVAW